MELRASTKSPTPADILLSQSLASKKEKKPSVPRVAELMPDARLIIPKKVTVIEQSQPTTKAEKQSLLETPSVSNILNSRQESKKERSTDSMKDA